MVDHTKNFSPAERLRHVRKQAGFDSAAAAARAFGWNEATYRHHENGTRGYDKDHARAYSRAFKVASGWLFGWQENPNISNQEVMMGWIESPDPLSGEMADLNAELLRLGGLRVLREVPLASITEEWISGPANNTIAYHAFSETYLRDLAKIDIDELLVVKSGSVSMFPLIEKDSILIVDTADREITEQDKVWLYRYGEVSDVRRLRAHPSGRIEAIADNIAIAPLPMEEGVKIFGRIVWVGKRL